MRVGFFNFLLECIVGSFFYNHLFSVFLLPRSNSSESGRLTEVVLTVLLPYHHNPCFIFDFASDGRIINRESEPTPDFLRQYAVVNILKMKNRVLLDF